MNVILRSTFPPKPTLTEENLPDQSGRVFIVTGGSGGLGKELVKILYQKNAKVYIAARSESKTRDTIEEVKSLLQNSTGELIHLPLDLADLGSIKQSAASFLSKESRLDVLWNNAGVMVPAQGSKTIQGYELQLGTNNLGHFLFTCLLESVLKDTAKVAPKDSVRVVWVSSSALWISPRPAIDFTNMDYKKDEGPWIKYGRSKCGTVIYASEFARRHSGDGVLHMSLDPGLFKTDLQKTMPKWQWLLFKPFSHHPKFGAYTELFAGLHPEITQEHSGGWVAPHGQLLDCPRKDLLEPGLGNQYWEWSETQVKPFM